ncbi:MAG: transcriptional repressor, partial [Solobacterium sp.]|nr:transcriptional repressor [Solobacterium sp.]
QSHPDRHITAREAHEQFLNDGVKIGLATVYRQMEKLVDQGVLIKYAVDEHSPACFVYSGHGRREECYHLKCTSCGRLIHLHCEEVSRLQEHILAEHGFTIDTARTVFYGLCASCRTSEKKHQKTL